MAQRKTGRRISKRQAKSIAISESKFAGKVWNDFQVRNVIDLLRITEAERPSVETSQERPIENVSDNLLKANINGSGNVIWPFQD